MDFYSYLYSACKEEFPDSVAFDAAVSGLKASLHEVFPNRIRARKRLVEFLTDEEAIDIIKQGTALIKTIPGENEHKRIARYVLSVFKGTKDREDLIKYLMKMGGVDEERAELIADDQMAKAAERFRVAKWKRQGCRFVKWVHKGAAEPRKYHLRKWNGVSGRRTGRPNGLNGFIFPIDKPPVIDQKTKERGFPGQLINCHCSLEPVW